MQLPSFISPLLRVFRSFYFLTGVGFLVWMLVFDANDLGKVEILGGSPFLDRELLTEAMRPNPQGNDDQQTPLVLVRV